MACNGDGTGPGGRGADGVRFVLDEAAAATVQIGPAGGTVTATGANGIRYSLAIPAGALPESTAITLTPIAGAERLPLSGGLLAGVAFAPEGLVLFAPAALSLALPTGTPLPAGLVGFGYRGDGASFHPQPITVGPGGGTLTLVVTHFSGAGAGGATALDLEALLDQLRLTLGPTEPSALYLALLVEAERALAVQICGGPVPATDCADSESELAAFESQITAVQAQILERWYTEGVRPLLQAADDGDDALRIATREFGAWEAHAIATFGEGDFPPAIESDRTDGRALLAQGYGAALERASEACDDGAVYEWFGIIELLALEGEQGLPRDSDELATRYNCLVFDVTGLARPLPRETLDTLRLRVGRRPPGGQGGAPSFVAWPEAVRLEVVGGCAQLRGGAVVTDHIAPDPETPSASALEVEMRTVAMSPQCDTIRIAVSTGTWVPDPRFAPYPPPFDEPVLGRSDTLRLALRDSVAVSVLPSTATVSPGGTHQFTAVVTGTTNTQVVWTTTQPGGTMSGTGLLTASQTLGDFLVVASSVADPTRSDTARITVRSGGRVAIIWNRGSANALAAAPAGVTDTDTASNPATQLGGYTLQVEAAKSGSWTTSTGEQGSGTGSGQAQLGVAFTGESGGLSSITVQATTNASGSVSGVDRGAGGYAGTESAVIFDVHDGAVQVQLSGSCALTLDPITSAASGGAGGIGGSELVQLNNQGVATALLLQRSCTSPSPTATWTETLHLQPGRYRFDNGISTNASTSVEHGIPSASAQGTVSSALTVVP